MPPTDRRRPPGTLEYRPRTARPPRTKLRANGYGPHLRYGRYSLIGASVVAGAAGFYFANAYISFKRNAEAALSRDIPADVSDRYKWCADDFDSTVNFAESFPWGISSSINGLRKKLMANAKGNVLEASVGTGRNAKYYPLTKGIKSVTMVDKSPDMLRVARIKWAETNTWFINASFWLQDAAEPIKCPSPQGFDTVIQTFGICSTPEPEKLLRNLGRMARPDTGKILLLEHGRSHYGWLNNLLDMSAPVHADEFGCWWNKDIGEIVKNSGLEVVEAKRFHLGTTWWFELKPLPRTAEQAAEQKVEAVVEDAKSKPWWAAIWK